MIKENNYGKLYTGTDVEQLHFDYPKQVLFQELDGDGSYRGGIAIDNYVICGACSCRVLLDECTGVFVYYTWSDLSEAVGSPEDVEDLLK